ncbi:hypothetical protein P175DRAFT_0427078 [Aspergillus ochraceoroseus IBT 24754]|uniref:BYS1 domain protein n=3 Tax=Aspergillus subgen. Nidulantes TaxID=2720870 RepID=A0A0F8WLX5_9EURO|nr:uncharacterized protein P175DRAFT_0427078 [Aspergillus ochraceoroseus IBT 24754]KKK12302.1 hypothetical protein ARAM_001386 [Aspergillus rambellii]KKK15463.1 hypothetical protein AOCH_004546 [Aspergillus ochraceoroseus]PTU24417.1 hypothetical protein P175DRAFT_0427078 [Aspergillus ochraceoroseus IBT 24754]
MHFNFVAFLSLVLALGTSAAGAGRHIKLTNNTMYGQAIVRNQCKEPLYLWSVGRMISPQIVIQSGQNYSEVFRRDQKTGGIAIKITTVMDGLYNSAPQTIFAYNLVDDIVWYDLSDVFGDPFRGEPVTLMPSQPEIRWEEGVPPRGSQVRMQEASNDLTLTIC